MEDLPPDDFLPGINSLRRQYAKKYKVPDMHELMWSENLSKILEPLDWSAPSWPDSRMTWRYAKLYTYDVPFYEKELINLFKKTPAEITEAMLNDLRDVMELFIPLQRFIACAPKAKGNDIFIVCLLGALGDFRIFHTSGQRTRYQTMCHKRYEDNDGLCVATNPGEEFYHRLKEDFLDDINEIRWKCAYYFEAANMHKLIWSEDLVEILKQQNWNVPRLENRKALRYASVATYDDAEILHMNEVIPSAISRLPEEKKKFIEEKYNDTLGLLEFTNPLQRFIGCGQKSEGHSVVCLFGAEGDFLFDNETFLFHSGSDCHKRYKKDNLLCVAINPDEESYYGRKEDFVDDVNRIRRDYAHVFNAPNMHQLVWSEELFNILESINMTENLIYRASNWRYVTIPRYENEESRIREEFDEKEEKIDEEFDYDGEDPAYKQRNGIGLSLNNQRRREFLNPLQKFIACGLKTDESPSILCLLGPERDYERIDVIDQFTSAPGSKCLKRYHNSDGLCVANNPNSESFYGHYEYFLEEVNQIRKTNARQLNVPDMHQLIWSEDLVKILEHINWIWSASRPEAGKTWRYTSLPTYTNAASYIEGKLYWVFDMSAARKEYTIRQSMDKYEALEELEFLNPSQRFIGCSRKPEKNTVEIVCLLGTKGDYVLYTDLQSGNVSGSDCHKGYKNVDGLCVANKPEEQSYYGRQEDFIEDINRIRRGYAHERTVANMHQLMWSNDLLETLKSLDWIGRWQKAGPNYRHVTIYNYDSVETFIRRDFDAFLAKSEDEQRKYLHWKLKYTFNMLELISPFQRFIACGLKTDRNNSIVFVCLLGPLDHYWMNHLLGEGKPLGSVCALGYKNIDGLCSIPVPTTIATTTEETTTTTQKTVKPNVEKKPKQPDTRSQINQDRIVQEATVENQGNRYISYVFGSYLLAVLFILF